MTSAHQLRSQAALQSPNLVANNCCQTSPYMAMYIKNSILYRKTEHVKNNSVFRPVLSPTTQKGAPNFTYHNPVQTKLTTAFGATTNPLSNGLCLSSVGCKFSGCDGIPPIAAVERYIIKKIKPNKSKK